MNRTALLLVAAVALSSTGCAKLREKLSGKASDTSTTTTSAGGSETTTTGGGATMTTGGSKLPDGWPASVPAYPGATITAAMATPQGKTAVMSTKDSGAKVHDFYKDKLSGMKLQSDVDLGGTKAMTFKSGTMTISVTVTPAGGAGDNNISVSIAGG